MEHRNESAAERHFLADSTLGRLAKWLRLMGFDTVCDSKPPDSQRLARLRTAEHRLVLTRCRKVFHRLSPQHVWFIAENDPGVQMRRLIRDLHLRREDVRPFSRCTVCNRLLHPVSKADALGLVPDYILEHQKTFLSCPQCHRIYWAGSHQQRWMLMVEQWFDN